MAPLPFSETGPRIVFYVVLGVFLAGEQRIRLRSLIRREGTHLDRGSFFVIVGAVGGGVGGAVVLGALVHGAAIGGARWPLFVLGTAVELAGIVLRQWSIHVLGRWFTTDVRVHAEQTVVDDGPYRWVRHPSYTGLLLALLGIGVALGNWLSIACALLVPPIGVVIRIRTEERALLDGLGEPYRAYAAGRARLLPHVW